MNDNYKHTSVLLNETITNLNIKPDGIYIDCTFGYGGHSKEILKNLGKNGKLYSIDKDPDAIQIANKLKYDSRFNILHGSFSNILKNFNKNYTQKKVNGILLDLGMSSMQIDNPNRGFSFLSDGPLDMRMNPNQGIPAYQWLKKTSAKKLYHILKKYGEERFAKKISLEILKYNKKTQITRTIELSDIIKKIIPYTKYNKHPARLTFQAIRIYINQEIYELKTALKTILNLLTHHGRLLVISFHSLEDRIVKNFMNKHSKLPYAPSGFPITEQQLKSLNKIQLKIFKKIFPSKIEMNINKRSRSAILRIAEKINTHGQEL
ncbi:MAG: 16S rRNA (cytosine(1402)-N(4))-methyltransferase RsmH [Buchnera aphidicola (Chaetogeoica yunlongensis)]